MRIEQKFKKTAAEWDKKKQIRNREKEQKALTRQELKQARQNEIAYEKSLTGIEKERLKTEQENMDAYTKSHLADASMQIQKALEAQYIYKVM